METLPLGAHYMTPNSESVSQRLIEHLPICEFPFNARTFNERFTNAGAFEGERVGLAFAAADSSAIRACEVVNDVHGINLAVTSGCSVLEFRR